MVVYAGAVGQLHVDQAEAYPLTVVQVPLAMGGPPPIVVSVIVSGSCACHGASTAPLIR